MSSQPEQSTERWYEFEQHETIVRLFYVKAPSRREAQRMVREDRCGLRCGVPDYAPDGAQDIVIRGRGRLANQQDAEDIAQERSF